MFKKPVKYWSIHWIHFLAHSYQANSHVTSVMPTLWTSLNRQFTIAFRKIYFNYLSTKTGSNMKGNLIHVYAILSIKPGSQYPTQNRKNQQGKRTLRMILSTEYDALIENNNQQPWLKHDVYYETIRITEETVRCMMSSAWHFQSFPVSCITSLFLPTVKVSNFSQGSIIKLGCRNGSYRHIKDHGSNKRIDRISNLSHDWFQVW